MAENNAVVQVDNPRIETEATVEEFQRSGFAIYKLSMLPRVL
jgi:hypothetical protein